MTDELKISDYWQLAESYRLARCANGEWMLVRTDGLPISPEERDIVSNAARAAARQGGAWCFALQAESIAPKARWIFPSEPSELFGVRDAVYFLVDDVGRPGLVKIGSTGLSVLSRVSHMPSQQGCINPQVVACALTPSYRRLEEGLHEKFDFCHSRGEWFSKDPILEYIEQFKDGGAS